MKAHASLIYKFDIEKRDLLLKLQAEVAAASENTNLHQSLTELSARLTGLTEANLEPSQLSEIQTVILNQIKVIKICLVSDLPPQVTLVEHLQARGFNLYRNLRIN